MIPSKQKAALAHRELERRANDEIKIFNPTGNDYVIRYGGYMWTVKKGNEMIVPRYIANHYIKHMTDALILEESARVVEREKKKYRGNFWPGEEERIALRTNNPELRKKYIKALWLGVVRKFGMDEVPESIENKPEDRMTPQDEQILEELGLEQAGDLSKEIIKEDPENTVEEFAKAVAE